MFGVNSSRSGHRFFKSADELGRVDESWTSRRRYGRKPRSAAAKSSTQCAHHFFFLKKLLAISRQQETRTLCKPQPSASELAATRSGARPESPLIRNLETRQRSCFVSLRRSFPSKQLTLATCSHRNCIPLAFVRRATRAIRWERTRLPLQFATVEYHRERSVADISDM